MPDFQLLCLLLSRVDKKQILLLRYCELVIQVLERHVKNRILPEQAEKAALALLFHEIGRSELSESMAYFHPDTLQRWYKQLMAQKWDYSAKRGRPLRREPLPSVLARLCTENGHWGYQTLSDQLRLLGYRACPNTVKNMLRRLGLKGPGHRGHLPPWSEFIEANQSIIASCDFLSVEVPNGQALDTYYVLFVLKQNTREVHIAGMTQHPDEAWMTQMARNLTMEGGFLNGRKYFICDRDTKFCKKFRQILASAGCEVKRIAWRSPNMNAFAERWVRSFREECLRRVFVMNPEMLWADMKQYEQYFNHERPQQGLSGRIPVPLHSIPDSPIQGAKIVRRSRLGGLLNFYYWESDEKAA